MSEPSKYHRFTQNDGHGFGIIRLDAIGGDRATVMDVNLGAAEAADRLVAYRRGEQSQDGQDIESEVERMRLLLKLRSWDDQVEWSLQHGGDGSRRSGRTCRGLLRAIATARRDGANLIAIDAEPAANRSYCIRMARDLLHGLGITHIDVKPDRMGVRPHGGWFVLYTDHHIAK